MLRGFYNAAQAMIVKQRELDAVSNNIANINTAGYKKDEIIKNTFQEEMILVNNRRRTSGVFVQTYADVTKTNLEQSNFDFTESKFDLGIFGNVYFNIKNPRTGEIFQTRNGQFQLDDQGCLSLNNAGRVQGLNGDIILNNDNFIVDANGVIYNETGEIIDTLLLTYIPPDANVAKIGDNLFRYDGAAQNLPQNENFNIIQGAIEMSNVDANKEITKAMEVQRHYEANSSILKYLDALNQRSANIAQLSK